MDRVFIEFGFTNDADELAKVQAFRDAAVADGWTIAPTYESEDVSRASRLTRDGYVMQVLTRDNFSPKYNYNTQVSIWCPKGIAIPPPDTYDWAEIQRRSRVCHKCGKEAAETSRVGFAGRACSECADAMRKELEKPGWTR